jgi:hypothetical protein
MIEIRSYRAVFRIERRLYRIDRIRLGPSGVPVRSVAYLAACIAAALGAARLPLLGTGLRLLPWWTYGLAIPALLATMLTGIHVEGRTFHQSIWSLVREWVRRGPVRLNGERVPSSVWLPGEIVFITASAGPRRSTWGPRRRRRGRGGRACATR